MLAVPPTNCGLDDRRESESAEGEALHGDVCEAELEARDEIVHIGGTYQL